MGNSNRYTEIIYLAIVLFIMALFVLPLNQPGSPEFIITIMVLCINGFTIASVLFFTRKFRKNKK